MNIEMNKGKIYQVNVKEKKGMFLWKSASKKGRKLYPYYCERGLNNIYRNTEIV